MVDGEWEEGGSVTRDTINVIRFDDRGTNSAFSHRIESEQTATVQNLKGWMSLFCYFAHVLNLQVPVGHAGRLV